MKQERDEKGHLLSGEKIYATGIKGFLPGLVCEPAPGHRKQYKENTVFEEKGGKICGPGMMHAADSVLDVLNYVSFVNSDGLPSEFAEVTALAPVERDGNKWATSKLYVGKKLSFTELVDLYIKDIPESAADIQIQNRKKICSFGNGARIGSSGYFAQISNSGDNAQIVSSGRGTQIASSGDSTQIISSGNDSRIASSGNAVWIGSSDYRVQISNSGDWTRIRSVGDKAKICSAGSYNKIVSGGIKAVVAAIGKDSIVSAELGSWIGLAEYDEYDNCICFKAAQIDGINLKPGVRYKLENGDFKEVK